MKRFYLLKVLKNRLSDIPRYMKDAFYLVGLVCCILYLAVQFYIYWGIKPE